MTIENKWPLFFAIALTGFMMLALTLLMGSISMTIGKIIDKKGFRPLKILGLCLMTLVSLLFACSFYYLSTPITIILLMLAGLGMGISGTSSAIASIKVVVPGKSSTAAEERASI